jgi:ubiquinone/menaquinone biosynthesis C-methylase UbiE
MTTMESPAKGPHKQSMDTDTKERIINNYNRIGKLYNAIAGRSEKQLRRSGLRQLHAMPGETILEIGFGTGHSVVEIAEAVGASGKVCGIDISNRMLEIAEARVVAAGYADRIQLQCTDALALPYPERHFDGLFMSFTLEVLQPSEMGRLLQQCRNVIRTDGRICVVGMSTKGKLGIMMNLYEWARAKLPNTIDCRPINVGELLTAAGFEVIEDIVTSFWGLSVEIVLSRRND